MLYCDSFVHASRSRCRVVSENGSRIPPVLSPSFKKMEKKIP